MTRADCRHGCGECLSACPHGVPIGEVLRARMYAVDYGNLPMARSEYALLGAGASPCLSCSAQPCQGACPHGVPIDRFVVPTHRLLSLKA